MPGVSLHTTAHPYARARFHLQGQIRAPFNLGRSDTIRHPYARARFNPQAQARFLDCTQTLRDEAVRRAYEGVRKMVLYKGEPVRYQGELRQVIKNIGARGIGGRFSPQASSRRPPHG